MLHAGSEMGSATSSCEKSSHSLVLKTQRTLVTSNQNRQTSVGENKERKQVTVNLLLRRSCNRYFKEWEETNFLKHSQNTHQREEFMSQEVKILEKLVSNFEIAFLRM